MNLRRRIWQGLQALTIAIGIVGFLLVGGAYGLLVLLANDGRMPFANSHAAPPVPSLHGEVTQ